MLLGHALILWVAVASAETVEAPAPAEAVTSGVEVVSPTPPADVGSDCPWAGAQGLGIVGGPGLIEIDGKPYALRGKNDRADFERALTACQASELIPMFEKWRYGKRLSAWTAGVTVASELWGVGLPVAGAAAGYARWRRAQFESALLAQPIPSGGPQGTPSEGPAAEDVRSRWSLGLEGGVGWRTLPDNEIPDGKTGRYDLAVLELRYVLPNAHRTNKTPARLDLQVDWLHFQWVVAATTRPRYPLCLYATWLKPFKPRRNTALSVGLYLEPGRDSFVVDEALAYGPAGTVALAWRVGRERARGLRKEIIEGTYLRGASGVMFGSDPNHLAVARYGRLGIERSWSMRPKSRRTP